MRYFRWALTAVVALLLMIFAVANRGGITLNFWPLPVVLQAPIYLVVLIALLAGFLIGALVVWILAGRARRAARQRAHRIDELERELAQRSAPQEAARALTRT